MKRNEKNTGGNSRNGSTIVGVLASLVFIGIVTTFMVKNTGSQSQVSRGYSALSTASTTTRSGGIVIEAIFRGEGDGALEMLQKFHNLPAGINKLCLLNNNGNRIRIGNNQAISCNLISLNQASVNSQNSRIEIGSGRLTGREVKRAVVYYNLGNIVVQSGDMDFGAKNAIYMDADLKDGNNGMDVNGDATFEKGLRLQNNAGIFRGNTWINNGLEILSKGSTFHGNTYINGLTKLQNQNSTDTLFRKDVGFDGKLSSEGGTFGVGGSVYMNDSLFGGTNIALHTDDKIDKKFWYTNKLIGQDIPAGPGDVNESYNPTPNATVNNLAKDFLETNRINYNKNKGPDLTNYSTIDIPSELGMGTLESRREVPLDVSRIEKSGITPVLASNVFSKGVTVKNLNDAFRKADSSNNLYNGHLVVKVTGGDLMFQDHTTELFGNKVIFIVDASVNVNGNFYNSTESASTMVYVTPKGSLGQFGCSGLFRGLIHVDPKNNISGNWFQWRDNSVVDGAIHFLGTGQVQWNTGSGNPTKINQNDQALAAFGSLSTLYSDDDIADGNFRFEDENERMIATQVAGYYYY